MNENHKPYIKPQTVLPEITIKGVILGVILSAVLAAANTYLGLFAGLTVAASIPAAVMSMAILRIFRNSNILENNAVQTAASAGESLAAGVIFTFPALILMGYWADFDYFETAAIALCGGVLGVLFTIPLRNALIVKQGLKFPEGIATAEVLKSGTEGGNFIKFLLAGGLMGALLKLCEQGFRLWEGILEKATVLGNKGYAYFGMNTSPALVAVGYIVGIRISSLVFLGGAITWWIAAPLYIAIFGYDGTVNELVAAGKLASAEGVSAVAVGGSLWSYKLRYLGVGAMLVGGLWALVGIRHALIDAAKEAMKAFRKKEDNTMVLRTERDIPMHYVLIGILVMIVPIFLIYQREINITSVTLFMSVVMVIAGFLFSAVAGYMAGLVGSSNNPISGVTIATVFTSSLLLLLLMGTDSAKGPAAAILIGAVVCCAAAIAGDNMQDLKSGYLLGATPFKQQIMQFIGVVAAALTIPFVLSQLNQAYGFGPKTVTRPDALAAPQATLMQSVADGVFGGNLPWVIVSLGALLGVLVIVADVVQERRGSDFRLPVLAVAVGLYLPFELDSAIMLGGIIAWLVSRYHANRQAAMDYEEFETKEQNSNQAGLLFASGLITGEALIGIAIAIPVAQSGDSRVMALLEHPLNDWIGFGLVLGVSAILYVVTTMVFQVSSRE
ncbi:MAG: oligopeptide transporter, OPT family [Chitinophagales bacterium]